MSGTLVVAGIGPGKADWITQEVLLALSEATDIVGYEPYVARCAPRPDQTVHASDNRVEIGRARHALELAMQGRKTVVVSGGDPGIFAMAAAVFEAIDHGAPEWRSIDVRILPGISAIQAAAARIGAPLGHDFCAISLSDNLKSAEIIMRISSLESILSKRAFSTLRILPFSGSTACVLRSRAILADPPAESPSTK